MALFLNEIRGECKNHDAIFMVFCAKYEIEGEQVFHTRDTHAFMLVALVNPNMEAFHQVADMFAL